MEAPSEGQEAEHLVLVAGPALGERRPEDRSSPGWEERRKVAGRGRGQDRLGEEEVEAGLEAVRTPGTLEVHPPASPARPASDWEPPVASPGEPRLDSSVPPEH